MLLFQSTCSFNGVSICKANKWLNISFKFIVKQYTSNIPLIKRIVICHISLLQASQINEFELTIGGKVMKKRSEWFSNKIDCLIFHDVRSYLC